jgi:hypothetical protein
LGEENEAIKAMKARVLIEQNSVSGKIVNVRENACFLPNCEIRLIHRWRITTKNRGILNANGQILPRLRAFLRELRQVYTGCEKTRSGGRPGIYPRHKANKSGGGFSP